MDDSRLWLAILMLLPAIAGLFVIRYGANMLRADQAFKKQFEQARAQWATTSGQILNSGIGTQAITTGDGETKTYVADISYQYQVAGSLYQGSNLTLRDGQHHWPQKKHLENRLRPYLVGQSVTVYYDPQAPENSALELADDASGIPVMGSLLVAFGVLFTLGWLMPGLSMLYVYFFWR